MGGEGAPGWVGEGAPGWVVREHLGGWWREHLGGWILFFLSIDFIKYILLCISTYV